MSNVQDYEAKIDVIKSIQDKDAKSPNMPVDVYVQGAEDILSVVNDHKDKFKAISFDMSLINDLSVRCGACREAESRWHALFNTKEDAQRIWLEESPKAYFMRDDLLDVLRYAFRKNKRLLNRARNIAKGKGHSDMIQDLNDIAALGRDNPKYFKAINFDVANFEKTDDMAHRMAKVLANAHKEDGISEARIIRDKAYTHLKEAMDEIKEAGKFIFRYNHAIIEKFSSDYFHKMNNGQKKEDEEEESSSEELSE